ncbi:hypothetical protein OG883_10435 [Streptomyces sp. NBC_01142]|uniref:hypothetical protein n=1 Tax=Streptomyces sp. NBC_01142 TaxID=2975865 RepID=UPI0022578A83|nr:hypothetical protein [Streptomyces sp. NBC_01142]MCX4820316.1 hypothetical protein [Streptomyces sp. NBC_01142]
MTVHQLPVEAGVFARYLRDLVTLLDRGDGWYGIFWQRDPEGMKACLDGIEIPPWDVVEALLQDLAAGRGAEFAETESVRARPLHAAAAAVHDRQPGGREALEERLELMLREQTYATGRAEELLRRLGAEAEGTPAAEQLAHELAWTRDDYARATARVAELRARVTAVDARDAAQPVPHGPARPLDGTPADPVYGGPADPAYGTPADPAHEGPADPAYGPGQGSERVAAPDDWGAAAAYDGHPRPQDNDTDPARRLQAGDPAAPEGPDEAAYADAWFRPEAAAGFPDRPAWDTYSRPAGSAHAGWAGGPETPAPPGDRYRPDADRDASPRSTGGAEAGRGAADQEMPAVPEGQPPAPAAYSPPERGSRGGRKRRPRGARFAGIEGSGDEIAAVPLLPVAADVPRGARYGGGAPPGQDAQAQPAAPPASDGARRATRETVAALGRLRAEGRSGEAHAVLCEAAVRPASWLPHLAAELHRAGLDADWATLLWEAASQPASRLAAAAGALAAAGRAEDSRQLLRQGVARPADEIAAAVIALEDEGRQSQARALLSAFVQVRTAEDAAGIADRDPHRLLPQLLGAARAVSAACERDLVHALRVAGHLGG